jgi:hypothetical protein
MTVATTNIITRDGARALGLKRFFTGEPCKHGHVVERYVRGGGCVECVREQKREWRTADLEKVREEERERARRYRAADPERARENWRRWRDAHPQARRMWQVANKDEINKRRRAAYRRAERAGSELNGAGLTGL